MKKVRLTVCLMATIVVMVTSQGFAVYFNDGLTHNIDYAIYDDVSVGEISGMQTN